MTQVQLHEAWAGPALRRCKGRPTIASSHHAGPLGPELDPASREAGIAGAFEQAVSALANEADFAGLEIVTHRVRRQGRTVELGLVVDRPESGVDLAACERIARRLNAALETYSEPYTLAVESAGLDRPLVRPSDYERFRDRNVKIVTTVAIDGRKTHRGRLTGVRGSSAAVTVDGRDVLLPLDAIKSANIDFDIRADLTRAKRERHARKNR